METQKKVEELLASLGNTADEVAQSLRDRGIKGTGYGPDNCPIQTFLSQELDEAGIRVGFETASHRPNWYVFMPSPVQYFIMRLRPKYKDLIDETSTSA